MSVLRTVETAERIIKKILEFMVFVLFAAMSTLVFAQVCIRFLTTSSLTWSEELSRFILIWLIYMASILAYSDKIHIVVDALVSILKGRLSFAVQLINRACVFVFAVCITLGAVEFMPTTAFQESPANGIIMSYVYAAIPISMVFIALIALKEICLLLRGGARPDASPDAGEEAP